MERHHLTKECTYCYERKNKSCWPLVRTLERGIMTVGEQAVSLAKSRLWKNRYTQSEKRAQVFSGYSDCSSLFWKIYERLGIYIGIWTGEQVLHGRQIWKNPSPAAYKALPQSAINMMKPGDLIFYGPGDAVHVEMYMGNGQQIGHGSGMGPVIKKCAAYKHRSGVYQIRRYTDEKEADGAANTVSEIKGGRQTVTVNMPILRKGMTGSAVEIWQRILLAAGYKVDVDGSFGPGTETQTRQFEIAAGITDNPNMVGPTAWKAGLELLKAAKTF